MKAKAQHSHLAKTTISATIGGRNFKTNEPLRNMQNFSSLQNSPPQFSSATTPIKQLRLSTSRCVPTTSALSPAKVFLTRPSGYRNYNMNKIPVNNFKNLIDF